jgi:hypothetical protein
MKTARNVAVRIAYDPGKTYFPPILFAPSDPKGIIGNTTAAQPGRFAIAAARSSVRRSFR